MTKRILLAGETFVLTQRVTVGYDLSGSGSYANGALHFLAALRAGGFTVDHLPSERCEAEFPASLSALDAYDAVVLSDIGALSLLYTADTRAARPGVNRLVVLHDWVERGGGLMMAGGYLSFQGMSASARYHGTPLEECLPVECLPHGDGLEAPEGMTPRLLAEHPISAGLPATLPPILGLNRVLVRPTAETTVLAGVSYRGHHHPLLAVRRFGQGRSLAWMTDIGPHWMSQAFLASPAYPQLMQAMVGWVAGTMG